MFPSRPVAGGAAQDDSGQLARRSGQFQSELLEDYAVVGELALEGHTRPIKGALSVAMEAAKQNGLKGIVVPSESAGEAAVVKDINY